MMQLKRRNFMVMAAVAVTASACASGSGSTSSSKTPPAEITVPLLIATSGPQAVYAPIFINGSQMAADKINAEGGIGGKTKIKIQTVDTRAEPAASVVAFNRVYDPKTMPLVLSAFSSQTLALLPVVEKRDAVMINGGGQDQSLGGQAPTLFNTIPLIANEAEALAKYAAGAGGHKTAAILYTNDDGGTAAADAFEKSYTAAGGKVVGKASGELNGTDFRSQLATLRSEKPDLLYLGVFGETNTTIIDQLGQTGWEVPLANTSWVNVPEVTENPGAVGMLFSSLEWNPDPAFVAEYKKLSGEEPALGQIGNYYDAIMAFAQAYELADEKGYGLDGKGVGKAMGEIEFTSSYGYEVKFENGVITRPMAISQVQPGGKVTVISEDATS